MSRVKFDIKAQSNGIIEYLKHEAKKSDEEVVWVGIQEKKKGTKPKKRKKPVKEREEKKQVSSNKEEPTNAQIGMWNEFGTKQKDALSSVTESYGYVIEFGNYHIPPRPFIRSTLSENREKYKAFRYRLMKKVLNKEITLDIAKKRMGQKAADDIKKKITELKNPPNAPTTIEKKGFDKPLIETAQMRNSVNYVIAKRSELE